jgi:hypothetical protein
MLQFNVREFVHQVIAPPGNGVGWVEYDCENSILLQRHCRPAVAVDHGKLGSFSCRQSKFGEFQNPNAEMRGISPGVNRRIRG